MAKSEFVAATLALVLVQGLVLITASPMAEVDRAPQPRLFSLGSIEGKTYFYDNSTTRSWEVAKTYCIGLGMRLATIKTVAQEAFLKTKYTASGFAGYFWMGARDARTISQFAWDIDNQAIASLGQGMSFHTHLTCIRYYASSSSTNNGNWDSRPCTDLVNVMCETF